MYAHLNTDEGKIQCFEIRFGSTIKPANLVTRYVTRFDFFKSLFRNHIKPAKK